ncbi:hypothetical protein [Noviherbaspirillum sp. ST9]|uniref:hypothetical protein n=1 Tax=Noviherbaspirillum sp. ST9 TaxID=3401606 RepID=UPI003B586054
MATSTLDPDNIPEPDRQLGKGHGTDALGPSDISDSGSDVQGGTRWIEEGDIGLDKGTTEDPDSGRRHARTDSDTDSLGTGERSTAGLDSDIEAGSDIDVDRIDQIDASDDMDLDEHDMPPPDAREPGRPQQGR